MGHDRTGDRVGHSELRRKFLEELAHRIEMVNHLRPCCDETLLALPETDKAVSAFACLGPVGIKHPFGIDPLLRHGDESVFAAFFAADTNVVEEPG